MAFHITTTKLLAQTSKISERGCVEDQPQQIRAGEAAATGFQHSRTPWLRLRRSDDLGIEQLHVCPGAIGYGSNVNVTRRTSMTERPGISRARSVSGPRPFSRCSVPNLSG